MSFIRPILIKCPESVISEFSIPAKYLEGTAPDRYLKLLCDRADYTPTNDEEGSRLVNTSFGVRMSAKSVRYGFKATIRDEAIVLQQVVERLAKLATSSSNGTAPTTLTVLDYLRIKDSPSPDPSIRYGFIYLPLEDVKGKVGNDGVGYYGGGFAFQFKDKDKELA